MNLKSGIYLSIYQKKLLSPKEMCAICDLVGFENVVEEILSLKYEDEPNYGKIIFLFQKLLLK
jgi:hypothetical protein